MLCCSDWSFSSASQGSGWHQADRQTDPGAVLSGHVPDPAEDHQRHRPSLHPHPRHDPSIREDSSLGRRPRESRLQPSASSFHSYFCWNSVCLCQKSLASVSPVDDFLLLVALSIGSSAFSAFASQNPVVCFCLSFLPSPAELCGTSLSHETRAFCSSQSEYLSLATRRRHCSITFPVSMHLNWSIFLAAWISFPVYFPHKGELRTP